MSLRLEPGAALREKRLQRLLAERGMDLHDPRLERIVEDGLLVGSLGLSGIEVPWQEARSEASAPPELAAIRRARGAVDRQAPLAVGAILAWHAALAGPLGFRSREEAAPHAPPEFVEDRLASLAEWLEAEGSAELTPEQKAAVALARIVEIRPFDDANGRVSRLAASHVMARAGLPPPILVAGDATRLRATLQAAFRLDTGPLVDLVREASGRALDVKVQALERGLVQA